MTTSTKLFIGAISLGIIGVGSYLYIQIQKMINSPFKVLGVTGLNLAGGTINFTLITQVTNNSHISAYVKNQDYQLFVNGKSVSTIVNKEEIFIGAEKTTTIPLKVSINKDALLKSGVSLLSLLGDKSKIKLEVKGFLTYKVGFIGANQPFLVTYTLQEIIDMASSAKTAKAEKKAAAANTTT